MFRASERRTAGRPRAGGSGRRRLALAALSVLAVSTLAGVVHEARRSPVSLPVGHRTPGDDSAHVQRWREPSLVLRIDESVEALGPGARGAIERALASWQGLGAGLPTIHLETGGRAAPELKPDGVNSVLVAPIDIPGHETDLAVTIGFSHPTSGVLSEADIVVNARHLFGDLGQKGATEPESCLGAPTPRACSGRYDLENVLAHEFGHFFGLGENPSDARATMFSCTSVCETHKRDLARADVEALVLLYASAPIAGLGCGAAQFSQGRGALGSTSALASLFVLACVIAARKRLEDGRTPAAGHPSRKSAAQREDLGRT